MATVQTRPWDPAEHLETLEDVVEYLDAAREDGDPRLVEAAFTDVMRSPAVLEASRSQASALSLGASSAEFDPRLPALLRLALSLRLRPLTARAFWDVGAPSVEMENKRHVRVFA